MPNNNKDDQPTEPDSTIVLDVPDYSAVLDARRWHMHFAAKRPVSAQRTAVLEEVSRLVAEMTAIPGSWPLQIMPGNHDDHLDNN